VYRIERGGASLRVITAGGAIESPAVVVATGYCHSPVIPAWPGRGRYRGELMHPSQYRNAGGFRGKRVLVVGAGNSGADIARDAARAGASAVWVSVRTPPQIVPRNVLGVPAQLAGIGLRRVPATIADPIARLEQRLFIGDLSNVGLPVPRTGLFSHHRSEGGLPVLDAGFAHGAEQGMFRVVPAVEALEADRVRLEGGGAISPDVVIAATGYHTGLEPLVAHLGVLDGHGLPQAGRGLWFTGFQNPISGALRELRFEASATARAVCSPGRC
jgi:putative flavoprotein involved in K+ transport